MFNYNNELEILLLTFYYAFCYIPNWQKQSIFWLFFLVFKNKNNHHDAGNKRYLTGTHAANEAFAN